jgi:hypothetical protein
VKYIVFLSRWDWKNLSMECVFARHWRHYSLSIYSYSSSWQTPSIQTAWESLK